MPAARTRSVGDTEVMIRGAFFVVVDSMEWYNRGLDALCELLIAIVDVWTVTQHTNCPDIGTLLW
jgi:hypothetical protein